MKDYLLLLFIYLTMLSCNENSKTIISMLPDEIYTEYNPIVLNQTCDEPQPIRILITKPHIFLGPPGTIDSTFQTLKISINDNYTEEFKISNDFTHLEDGKRKNPNTKYFDFKMPSHKDIGSSEGIIKIELFYKNNLEDDYIANFQFVKDDQEILVVKRTGTTGVISNRKPVLDKRYNFKIRESGVYADDIKYTYRVKKTNDNFEVTIKGLGGNIYKVDKSGKNRLVTTIPESAEIKTYVPLGFQLEETNKKSGRVGNVVLNKKDIGKIPGYVFNHDAVGFNQKIKFVNCTKTVISEKAIYLPTISSWAPVE